VVPRTFIRAYRTSKIRDKEINSSQSGIGTMRTKHDVPSADKDNVKNIDTRDLRDPGQEGKGKRICQLS
jgi:hypothetical protein